MNFEEFARYCRTNEANGNFWICPHCGRIHSLEITECPYCVVKL